MMKNIVCVGRLVCVSKGTIERAVIRSSCVRSSSNGIKVCFGSQCLRLCVLKEL